MSIIDTLITDRTAADVDRWRELRIKGLNGMTPGERSEWLAGMRGAYNATDLNRVGGAMEYISSRFQAYGYSAPVAPKLNWSVQDIPSEEHMTRYLSDLQTLRSAFAVLTTTPPVPADMERLWWHEANSIEQILVDINIVIERVFKSFRRSGSFMFYSGHQPLPSADSDLGRTWEEIDALSLTWGDLDDGTDWYTIMYGRLK